MTASLGRLLLLAALVPAACAGQSATPTAPPSADAAGIVWLCLPGKPQNPCAGDLSTTVIDPSGHQSVTKPEPAADPPIDCFFVYPTTSRQTTINADLSIDPEERVVAAAEAAPFSQVCKVYAPIYPQLTSSALNSGRITEANVETAYNGVRDAFADYLASYNHGRGVVFIGHSQGAMLLSDLLRLEVDMKPEVRKLIVSALLMGGNVTVAEGKTTGGDFANIPACTSQAQTGCVVGYSSFEAPPPLDAQFGRVGGALVMLSNPKPATQQILCVNPAAIGGKGTLQPIFATADLAKFAGAPKPVPTTPYVSYPDELSAECRTSGDATWLQITRLDPNGSLPAIAGSEGPGWGLHDLDVHLALGSLVALVRSEAAAFHA